MDSNANAAATPRAWLVISAIIGSAVLFYFGTGFFAIGILTWIAPLPVMLIALRMSARAAVTSAFVSYFLGTANNWALYVHSVDVPLIAAIAINVTLSALFAAAVLLFHRCLRHNHVLLAAIAAPALWTCVEYLISLVSPIGFISPLATAQGDIPVILQTASVTGAWGVSFAVLLVPSTIAALSAAGVAKPARIRAGACVAVVMAIVLSGGAIRLFTSHTGLSQKVAVVAHNHSGWGADVATKHGQDVMKDYLDELSKLPNDVTTAVLPEGVFSTSTSSQHKVVSAFNKAAADWSINIVVGVVKHDGKLRDQTAIAFNSDGSAPVTYRKHHDRSPGPRGTTLTFPWGKDSDNGIEICADLLFSNPSRDYADAGARLMLVPASTEGVNGWQQSRVGLLRSVENGFAMAWSGRDGVVMANDSFGRVKAEAHTTGNTTMTTQIAQLTSGGDSATLYNRFGDWFAWLCIIVALTAIVLTVRKTTSRRDAAPQTSNEESPDAP